MALMSSFYGGRRGASFIIVKNYLDVLSMVSDFSQGNDFIEVNFDEYVIINNPNKNHPDNGKIFRRGYDYNSDRTLSNITVLYNKITEERYLLTELTEEKYKNLSSENDEFRIEQIQAHGAEYIGCIAGPAGKAPLLSIGPYEWAQNKNADASLEIRKGSGEYGPNGENPGLIPGKDDEGNYNDAIEWTYASIRNDNYGDDTQAFIGFKFPYLVTQMQTSQVDPYDGSGNIADMSNIFRVLGENETIDTHPYYNKWHLNIPKGVKGDTFKNLKVISYRQWLRNLSDSAVRIMYDATQTELIEYTPDENDLDRHILIYEDWNYDNKQTGQVKYYYLGKYNQIENVTFENGILTFLFTYDDDRSFIFDYVSKIELEDNGTLTFTHSILDDETNELKKDIYRNKIQWINDLSLDTGSFIPAPVYEQQLNDEGDPIYDEEGNPVYKVDEEGNPIQATDEDGEPIYNVDNWVQNVDAEGLFKIIFNNGNEYRAYIPFVNNIEYDDDSGWISYHILGPDMGRTNSLVQIKCVKKFLRDSTNGKMIVVYNTPREGAGDDSADPLILDETISAEIKVQIGDREYQVFPVKTLQNIQLNESTGELTINYINGQSEILSSNLYTIERFEYDPQESKLYIKKSTEEQQEFPIPYPVRIRYNSQSDTIEYIRAGETNYNRIGNLPLLKNIQLTDNLDLYIQMNGREGYQIISETGFENDENHPTSQNWINLGNLSKTLPVMGIARNYTREELKNEILENELWSTADEYADLRERLDNENEYTNHKLNTIIDCLNLLYPDGMIPDTSSEEGEVVRFRLITAGENSELKDFFAFDLFKNKTIYQRTILEDETIEVTETNEAGSWYFLGRIESDRTITVGSLGESTNLPQSGGVLLTRKRDICSISFPDTINPFSVKNKMKEIKVGNTYKNKIYNIAASEGLIITMTGVSDATAQSYFNIATKEINIPAVTGDITIRRE